MSPLDMSLLVNAMDIGAPFPVYRDIKPVPDGGPTGVPPRPYLLLLRETMRRLQEAERIMAEQQERIEYLETLSTTDELTGLLNRRGFMAALRRELAAARRTGQGGILLIVDLDDFKSINDDHGHVAGDAYLQQAARILTESVRSHDIVARIGGDEFAVLLTQVDSEAGLARAESLTQRFNTSTLSWQQTSLPLRASFGSTPFKPGDQEDALVRRADIGMYKNKAARKVAR